MLSSRSVIRQELQPKMDKPLGRNSKPYHIHAHTGPQFCRASAHVLIIPENKFSEWTQMLYFCCIQFHSSDRQNLIYTLLTTIHEPYGICCAFQRVNLHSNNPITYYLNLITLFFESFHILLLPAGR